MIPVSVLDLVTVRQGGTLVEAMAETAALAQVAETAGCKRFWVAEHHGMPGIAGGATSVVLAHVGHATRTIRIGAGGIMLPNHNPFVIAEQFGTLDALFPGRIDLGLGRAPGADQRIAHALRKDLMAESSHFPADVVELQAYFADDAALPIKPTAGPGAEIDLWILGSSLFGAQLAAHLGLPFAFASHFAPAQLDAALDLYRQRFQPSQALDRPRVMVAMNVIVADSDEEGRFLASSMDQSFVALRTGDPGRLPPPVEGYRESLAPHVAASIAAMREASAVGSPETVSAAIAAFIRRTGADELIVSGMIWDPEIRKSSLVHLMQIVEQSAPA